MNTKSLVLLLYVLFSSIIAILYILLLIRFQVNRHNLAFVHRVKGLLQLNFIGFFLALFVERPLYMIIHLQYIPQNTKTVAFQNLVTVSIINLTLYFVVLMFYLWFYQLMYARELLSGKWVHHLRPSVEVAHGWYVQNAGTWGKWTYVAWYVLLYWIVFAVADAILSIFNLQETILSSGIWLVGFLPLLGFCLWMSCYAPDIADIFLVRRQLSWGFRFGSIGAVLYISVVIAFSYVNEPYWRALAMTMVVTGVNSAIFVLLVEFPLRRGRVHETTQPDIRGQNMVDLLKHIFMNRTLFEKFMAHTMKEFAHEGPLFIVEVTQFKMAARKKLEVAHADEPEFLPALATIPEYIKKLKSTLSISEETVHSDRKSVATSSSHASSTASNSDILIPISEDIPHSSIVDDQIPISAFEIYHKYVSRKAPLEINISWECRRKLGEIFEPQRWLQNSLSKSSFRATNSGRKQAMFLLSAMTIDDLERVFDGAYREIIHLLLGSVARFVPERDISLSSLLIPDDVGRIAVIEQEVVKHDVIDE